jgi:hypothetical protein
MRGCLNSNFKVFEFEVLMISFFTVYIKKRQLGRVAVPMTMVFQWPSSCQMAIIFNIDERCREEESLPGEQANQWFSHIVRVYLLIAGALGTFLSGPEQCQDLLLGKMFFDFVAGVVSVQSEVTIASASGTHAPARCVANSARSFCMTFGRR